jgi:AraC-like DNA-binding protein
VYFEKINETNKFSLNKLLDSDMIYYSELKEWYTANAFRSFSIKFVTEKCITYEVGNRLHHVQAGNYLLACRHHGVKAYFKTKQPVKSICIDLCPATMAEVFSVLTTGEGDPDNYLTSYFRYPEFYEAVHSSDKGKTGMQLQLLHACILATGKAPVNREWFLGLAESIILQEYGNYVALKNVASVKPSTKQEILQRLQVAIDYMDEHFLSITDIKEIAAHCSLSEYHFFRRFKQVYHKTPNQYLTEKKMQRAKDLIEQEKHTVTEIAAMCSFPDVHTFSKAFKKFYGVAPSLMRYRS